MKKKEFETKIEIVGVLTDALIGYECDPEDGWPIISSIKAYVVKKVTGARGEVDLTPIMDEYQLHSFASEINDALNADRNALRIEQMELRRMERDRAAT